MMDYDASITYRTPITENAVRAEQATAEGRFLGLRLPDLRADLHRRQGLLPDRHHRAHRGPTRSTCPRPACSPTTRSSRPIQYPGQTETEPFARVHVLLDGSDVVMGYQPLIEVPNDQVRIGMRVAAVWASEGEKGAVGTWNDSNLVGWMPTGEPDVDDPTLVNRIN